MQTELLLQRKMPRLFLAQEMGHYKPLRGMKVVFADRRACEVLDISYSGIVVSVHGVLSKHKIGAAMPLTLKFESGEEHPLKMKLIRLTAEMMGFAFESISSEGRLLLDQVARDKIIQDNLRIFESSGLHPLMRAQAWFHGPFDTNFFFWQDGQGKLQKFLLEYDHLILIFENGKMKLAKSHSVVDPAKGYSGPLLDLQAVPLTLGASWLDRLLKIFESTLSAHPELNQLQETILDTLSL